MKNLKLFCAVSLLCLVVSCAKETIHIDPSNPNAGEIKKQIANKEFYAKGKLNGADFSWQVTGNKDDFTAGVINYGSFSEGIYTCAVSGTISKLKFPSRYPSSIEIEFRTLRVNYEDDKLAYFKSFITKGQWQYASVDKLIEGTKNIKIKIENNEGKKYASTLGVQTGSTFTVVNVDTLPETLVRKPTLKVKVSLNCKLYPVDGQGNPISLTEAEAVILIETT